MYVPSQPDTIFTRQQTRALDYHLESSDFCQALKLLLLNALILLGHHILASRKLSGQFVRSDPTENAN